MARVSSKLHVMNSIWVARIRAYGVQHMSAFRRVFLRLVRKRLIMIGCYGVLRSKKVSWRLCYAFMRWQ